MASVSDDGLKFNRPAAEKAAPVTAALAIPMGRIRDKSQVCFDGSEEEEEEVEEVEEEEEEDAVEEEVDEEEEEEEGEALSLLFLPKAAVCWHRKERGRRILENIFQAICKKFINNL